MYYVEFIDRDRSVPIEVFRYLGNQETSWVEGAEDRMVLQLGRTLRLGPQPSYLAFWKIKSLERLDRWEEYFGSSEWSKNERSNAMHRSVHIQRAGLYEELRDEPGPNDGLFYVEYLEIGSDRSDDDVLDAFEKHRTTHLNGKIRLMLRRLGQIGPEPNCLAIWSYASYEQLEPFLRSRLDATPFRIITAGIYRKFGSEIL